MINISENMTLFFLSMDRSKNSVLMFLLESYVPKNILLSNYRLFIKENGLTPIERLFMEEKIKLWEEVKSTGINKDKIVDAAKILHTLKFINENS